jgi:hypothetical protein
MGRPTSIRPVTSCQASRCRQRAHCGQEGAKKKAVSFSFKTPCQQPASRLRGRLRFADETRLVFILRQL